MDRPGLARPLADVSGYVGLIQRTVGELTTSGGSITLNAGGSVVLQQGSLLNVSGGYVQYQGAVVNTTRLLGSDGHLYDISQASPDITYVGIAGQFTVDHTHWGVTDVYTSPLLAGGSFQEGYIQGGAGGSISIQAPTAAIDGDLLGLTVTGERQRTNQPTPSSLSLSLGAPAAGTSGTGNTPSITSNVVFDVVASQTAVPFDPTSLTLDPTATITLSPALVGADGFGSLSVNTSNGSLSVLAPITTKAGTANSISLTAANIDVEADITVPGGTISLTTVPVDPNQGVGSNGQLLTSVAAGRGALTLSANAALRWPV